MSLAASSTSADSELIATLDQAVGAVEALFADARRAVAEQVVREGRPTRARSIASSAPPTASPGSRPICEAFRQLAAYAQRLSATGNFGELEELAGPHRRRRISGADRRRHSDEPGRDRAALRPRPWSGGGGGAHEPRGRASDRLRQYRAAPRAAGRTDARSSSDATVGDYRARRHARIRSATRCANSPTARSCRTPRNGICATNTSRSISSRRCPSSACSA